MQPTCLFVVFHVLRHGVSRSSAAMGAAHDERGSPCSVSLGIVYRSIWRKNGRLGPLRAWGACSTGSRKCSLMACMPMILPCSKCWVLSCKTLRQRWQSRWATRPWTLQRPSARRWATSRIPSKHGLRTAPVGLFAAFTLHLCAVACPASVGLHADNKVPNNLYGVHGKIMARAYFAMARALTNDPLRLPARGAVFWSLGNELGNA